MSFLSQERVSGIDALLESRQFCVVDLSVPQARAAIVKLIGLHTQASFQTIISEIEIAAEKGLLGRHWKLSELGDNIHWLTGGRISRIEINVCTRVLCNLIRKDPDAKAVLELIVSFAWLLPAVDDTDETDFDPQDVLDDGLEEPHKPEIQQSFETDFGLLEVLDLGGLEPQRLALDGTELEGFESRWINLDCVWDLEDGRTCALVTEHDGGNTAVPCPRWLILTDEGFHVSEEIGTGCAMEGEPWFEDGKLIAEYRVFNMRPNKTKFTFDVNTFEMTITESEQADFGWSMAGAGDDCLRWVGRHTTEIFADPGERLRFQGIMNDEEMEALWHHMIVAGEAGEVGPFVVGEGGMPHDASARRGAWALHVDSGEVFAMIREESDEGKVDVRCFGAPKSHMPDCLRKFAETGSVERAKKA